MRTESLRANAPPDVSLRHVFWSAVALRLRERVRTYRPLPELYRFAAVLVAIGVVTATVELFAPGRLASLSVSKFLLSLAVGICVYSLMTKLLHLSRKVPTTSPESARRAKERHDHVLT